MPVHKSKRVTQGDAPTRAEKTCADWCDAFLAVLATNANVTKACEAVGIARKTAYEHRSKDADFAAEWDDALEAATDLLEHEARRRAMDGTEKPVYQGGELVGYVREYSDALMTLLLKAHRPKRFRERMDLTGADGGPLKFESMTPEDRKARIAELLAKREGEPAAKDTEAGDAADAA
jgi:hypothetical protein